MIVYQQHIMWYESEIVDESLLSLHNAIKNSPEPIQLIIGINCQTSLEKPVSGSSEDIIQKIVNHPTLKDAGISIFYDEDKFFNIGDWRRKVYFPEAKYTVWGETDCLIPEDYFYILSNLKIEEPHILSLSSRIMWDDSWTGVEHEELQKYPNLDNQNPSHEELAPFRYYDVINQEQLNKFNEQTDIKVSKLPFWKVDGALLSLSGNLPHPFIPEDMHFVREDTCTELFFKKHNIPQYHINTRMKGHNYYHPRKRTNTLSTRTDKEWKELELQSTQAMINFLK